MHHQQYICKNLYIKDGMENIYQIPIAHGEGRYYADEKTLAALAANDQVLFRYCDADGHLTAGANVNGSTNSIAGICNKERNVIGMMPHPERACTEALGNTDGRRIFNLLFSDLLETATL
jgi:phosphoribosylformylglycinamidine (FGAM) synthase-like amidotransferase family enzyme